MKLDIEDAHAPALRIRPLAKNCSSLASPYQDHYATYTASCKFGLLIKGTVKISSFLAVKHPRTVLWSNLVLRRLLEGDNVD
jgi:hypothetical protein